MKPRQDFLLRVIVALVLTAIVAPIYAWLYPTTVVHRVLTRTFQILLAILLILKAGRPSSWKGKLPSLGIAAPHAMRRMVAGAVLILILFSFVLWLSYALGGREALDRPHRYGLWFHLSKAAFNALVVAFFEEMLVRGYLKNSLGSIVSAGLFAALHYFRPLLKVVDGTEVFSPPSDGGYDPGFLFRHLHYLGEGWTDLQNVTLGLSSLFLFGMALNRLRERTGTLFLGIGVHAGLVFALFIYRRFLVGNSSDPWIWGHSRIHDGAVGTAAVAIVCLAAYYTPLPGWARAKESSRGPGAGE